MVPSRKFIYTVILILLVTAGSFWLFKNKKTEIKPPFQKGESFISGLFQKNQDDSDNDGLQDWEEILWKTDPNNPDTDGDGTPDGEEIKQSRNPLKAGPDDKLKDVKIFSQENISGDAAGLTKTDILARDFFANFLSLYQSGKLDEQNKKKLTESFLAEINQEKLPDQYKLSDIKIINDNSNTALKNYGDETARIINKYQATVAEDEITIINRALKEESGKELQKLDSAINLYQNVSRDLLQIKIPSDMSSHHLNLINSAYNLSLALMNIKETLKDPIKGIIGLNQYKKEYLRIKQTLWNISKFFTNKEIFFSKNEEGYKFWINNISK